MRRDPRNAHHLATISYDGRFWDAYLELQDAQTPDSPARGRIAFSAANEGDPDSVHTTTIFIENTPQDVLTRARDFKTHQLVALLRSAIPTEEERSRTDDAEQGGRQPATPEERHMTPPEPEPGSESEGAGPRSGERRD